MFVYLFVTWTSNGVARKEVLRHGLIFSIAACCLLNSSRLCKIKMDIVGALYLHSCIIHVSFSGPNR